MVREDAPGPQGADAGDVDRGDRFGAAGRVLPVNTVAELTNIGILSAFIVVCIAVAVLRRTRPEVPRTFTLPFMPVIPIIGVVFSGWLILSLPWETWLRFGIWLILGLIVYFFYSRTHSKLEVAEPVPRG